MDFNPYLTFDGNCREAFEFYARTLGGEVAMMQRFADMPGTPMVDEAYRDHVMHARLRLGERVLMGSDHGGMGHGAEMQGFSLQIGFDNLGDARAAFDALAVDGAVVMPFAPTFWAAGFGMLRDRFGVPWMVNCDSGD